MESIEVTKAKVYELSLVGISTENMSTMLDKTIEEVQTLRREFDEESVKQSSVRLFKFLEQNAMLEYKTSPPASIERINLLRLIFDIRREILNTTAMR